jgi:hypothetical protein
VFARLSEVTVTHSAAVEQEQQEVRELERRDSLIIEACRMVLGNLDGAQPGG